MVILASLPQLQSRSDLLSNISTDIVHLDIITIEAKGILYFLANAIWIINNCIGLE